MAGESVYAKKLWLKSYEQGVPERVSMRISASRTSWSGRPSSFRTGPPLFSRIYRFIPADEGHGGSVCRSLTDFGFGRVMPWPSPAERDPLRRGLLCILKIGAIAVMKIPSTRTCTGSPVQRLRVEVLVTGPPGEPDDRSPAADIDPQIVYTSIGDYLPSRRASSFRWWPKRRSWRPL
jgi:hypothetical protein